MPMNTSEILSAPQLLKKFPHCMVPEGARPRLHSRPILPVLSQINPIRPLQSYLFQIDFNNILPPTSISPNCLNLQAFKQKPVRISLLPKQLQFTILCHFYIKRRKLHKACEPAKLNYTGLF